jgi:hypothetical protein
MKNNRVKEKEEIKEREKKEEEEKDRKKTRCLIITGFSVIIVLWLASWLLLIVDEPVVRGTTGDMFGAVNALFSGLAFAGIIITILLQRKELSLQRDELILTREELKRTADAQERSEIALNRQAENLKVSAKLSALSTLVTQYSETELRIRNAFGDSSEYIAKKQECIKRIEEILEKKEND